MSGTHCEVDVPDRDRIRTLVLPEGTDKRVVEAARRVAELRLGHVVLVASRQFDDGLDASTLMPVDGLQVVDCARDPRLESYVDMYGAARKLRHRVAARLLRRPLMFGAMMVAAGDADALVAGASSPTSRVISSAQATIGLAEGFDAPTSFFLMIIPPAGGNPERRLIFADCAVRVEPSVEQLVMTAIAAAGYARILLDSQPRVAILSFSTHGSAVHGQVDRIRAAVAAVRARAPDLIVDGDLQVDAAVNPRVAAAKVRRPSEVAGKANVLVFPDLNAGNIGYKLVQEFAGAAAIGPFLIGFRRPVTDLSRGATVDDIVSACRLTLALAEAGS